MQLINIIGASGHAKSIIDLIPDKNAIVGVYDDNLELTTLMGLSVTTPIPPIFPNKSPLVIAIGDNRVRCDFARQMHENHQFVTIIHDSAIISTSAQIGSGSVVMERVVLKVDSCVGDHVILNTASTIDHDCYIGDFVHIGPGCTLCGNVQIGEGTLVGAGSVILPNVKVGKWCTIGAGSVVIEDLEDGGKWIGNRAISKKMI
ncbi:acetyltransferase [Belliella kenyensis]|uniref:Acetyltransferase n=1 Tax=Belliella kenyensis TaxID=1472724 RepID=A0ABV8EIL1_9BACT|nr:acetyltransferase [Belliella kenyensis]MCH7401750.1 acetyltransferase [Belliella kenyensis]MDN3604249.1 acetyltransferase [Belliella kenyensis]